MGVWEPGTLSPDESEGDDARGDGYFSVRGELIYTRPDDGELVVKIRQQPRPDGRRPTPFKLQLKGQVDPAHLRHFVSLDLRRDGRPCRSRTTVIAQCPNGLAGVAAVPAAAAARNGARPTSPPPLRLATPTKATAALRAGVAVAGVSVVSVVGPCWGSPLG